MLKFQLPIRKFTQAFPKTVIQPPILRTNVIPGNLQDEGQRILDANMGRINGFVLAQRQICAAGTVEDWQQVLSLPALTVTYHMQFGREMVSIDVYPTIESVADLCLLVLYDGNKLAAIPMDRLQEAAPVYQASLSSGWGSDFFMSAQVRPSADYSPIYAPLSFGDTISRTETYMLSWVGEADAGSDAGLNTSRTTATPAAYIPMLVASAAQVFTPFDKFSFADQTISGRTAAPDATHPPWTITTDGAYCYGLQSESPYFSLSNETRDLVRGLTIGSWEIKLPGTYQVYSAFQERPLSPYYMSDSVYDEIKPLIHPEEGYSPAASVYYAERLNGALEVKRDIKVPPGDPVTLPFDVTATLSVPCNVATVSDQFTPTTTQMVPCSHRGLTGDQPYTHYEFNEVQSGPTAVDIEVTTVTRHGAKDPTYTLSYAGSATVVEKGGTSSVVPFQTYYVMHVDNLFDCATFGPPTGGYFEELLTEEQYFDPNTYLAFTSYNGITNVLRPPGGEIPGWCPATNSEVPAWSGYTVGSWTVETVQIVVDSVSRALHVNSFPFSLKIGGATKHYYSVESFDENDARQGCTHYTPYGSTTNTLDFIPWLHADNGKHVIQGYGFGTAPSAPSERYLYLDGEAYGQKLADALNTSLDKINAIFMDVPLSRIRNFR